MMLPPSSLLASLGIGFVSAFAVWKTLASRATGERASRVNA